MEACVMNVSAEDLLKTKKVLIVDDETDVLETLEGLLYMCKVTRAHSFREAKELLETESFDVAVLDIMGVDGYALLEIAKRNKVISVMLTAHALSVQDTIASFEKGAAFFVPKEKMGAIATYLNDVLGAKEKGQNSWWRWLDRFASYYDKKFDSEWRNRREEFLEKMKCRTL
jgi:DNA-binding NtrC family response regulator